MDPAATTLPILTSIVDQPALAAKIALLGLAGGLGGGLFGIGGGLVIGKAVNVAKQLGVYQCVCVCAHECDGERLYVQPTSGACAVMRQHNMLAATSIYLPAFYPTFHYTRTAVLIYGCVFRMLHVCIP